MSLFDYERQRVFGMVVAVVSNHQDPDGLGRVRVRFHMLDQQVQSGWCRVVSLYGGAARGIQWLPEEGDEVVVAFEHGDVNFPFIIGSVHHGKAKPPVPQNKDNNIKLLKTRSGHTLSFDDKKGDERIRLVDSSGKQHVEIDVKNKRIVIESESGDLTLRAPSGTLTLDCKKLDIRASESAVLESKGPLTFRAAKKTSLEVRAELSISAAQAVSLESQSQGISLKASTALKAQAAQLELKSSGPGSLEASANLIVKGAKVMIN